MQFRGAAAAPGGYGDPAERAPEALEDDLTSGKFDEAWLAERYPQQGGDSQES